jgi:hypothetical protein
VSRVWENRMHGSEVGEVTLTRPVSIVKTEDSQNMAVRLTVMDAAVSFYDNRIVFVINESHKK